MFHKWVIALSYFLMLDHVEVFFFSFRNKTVQKELQDWNLELKTKFLALSGRTLREVRIHQGRRMVR